MKTRTWNKPLIGGQVETCKEPAKRPAHFPPSRDPWHCGGQVLDAAVVRPHRTADGGRHRKTSRKDACDLSARGSGFKVPGFRTLGFQPSTKLDNADVIDLACLSDTDLAELKSLGAASTWIPTRGPGPSSRYREPSFMPQRSTASLNAW